MLEAVNFVTADDLFDHLFDKGSQPASFEKGLLVTHAVVSGTSLRGAEFSAASVFLLDAESDKPDAQRHSEFISKVVDYLNTESYYTDGDFVVHSPYPVFSDTFVASTPGSLIKGCFWSNCTFLRTVSKNEDDAFSTDYVFLEG